MWRTGRIVVLFQFAGILSGAAAQQPNAVDCDYYARDRIFYMVNFGQAGAVKSTLICGANIEARDDNGETPLIRAVEFGKPDVVELLLDSGANVEAKDNGGTTALFEATVRYVLSTKASSKQTDYLAIIKLLLGKGADVNAADKSGDTPMHYAVTCNFNGDFTALIHLFKEPAAAQTEPSTIQDRDQLERSLEALKLNPAADGLRKQIISFAATLRPPLAVPGEAREHFMKGIAEMQLKNPTPMDIQTAAAEFRQVLNFAPWWADAYYNLARALEVTGQYDDAIQQMNFYLAAKPSTIDVEDAQARIYAIRAEQQSAARAKEEHERELPLKYVSAGVQRLRVDDAPTFWHPVGGGGVGELYAYRVPEEDPYLANVFRMPNGHLLAIVLAPVLDNCPSGLSCQYSRDNIVIVDITSDSCLSSTMNRTFSETPTTSDAMCGQHYMISVSTQPNALVSVTDERGANVTLPASLLYRARAVTALGQTDGELYQATWWPSKEKSVPVLLKFSKAVLDEAHNPDINPLSLIPSTFSVLEQ